MQRSLGVALISSVVVHPSPQASLLIVMQLSTIGGLLGHRQKRIIAVTTIPEAALTLLRESLMIVTSATLAIGALRRRGIVVATTASDVRHAQLQHPTTALLEQPTGRQGGLKASRCGAARNTM